MAEKFTPGPWKVQRTNQGVFIEGNVEKPIGYLAQVRGIYRDGNRVMEDANAALIAAAPELYEALKNIASYIGDLPRHYNFQDEYDQAETALAKARGEESTS